MRILVLNPGSSTLKFRLLDLAGDRPSTDPRALDAGTIEHGAGASTAQDVKQGTQALAQVIARTQAHGIQAVGCRVVHGGERFSEPALVTPDVLTAIRDLGRLAPLHNPVAAAVLSGLPELLPGVPVVAVFDTAFHRTIPDVAGLYALPPVWSKERGLRRYGFHGTSHRYVAARLGELVGKREGRLITCHLGNGASICAVRGGRSVDTSMGLTPLEGLVMGTRSGDVDPGLVLHLIRAEGLSADEVDRLLNQQSGLKGVGGHGDMRELQAAIAAGDESARLAQDMFAYRVRKYIGAYAAVLEGVDGIAFTGGIGEHSAEVREKICAPLGWLGVELDAGRNAGITRRGEECITRPGSAVAVWVVPTDEEGLIAQLTAQVVRGHG